MFSTKPRLITIWISHFNISLSFSSQQTRNCLWNAQRSSSTAMILFQLLVLINFSVFASVHAKLNLCDVETGQTNIILDISESRGDGEWNSDLVGNLNWWIAVSLRRKLKVFKANARKVTRGLETEGFWHFC